MMSKNLSRYYIVEKLGGGGPGKASCRLALGIAFTFFLAECGRTGPPFSPEESLKRFRLPPGFRIELVAAEPDVVDPVAMAFDERGRLFVVEMNEYPLSADPLGKIKLLEDEDGDGRFEKSTVFVEGLHFAHGVLPWKDGILVTSAPDILYFADTDGDNRADLRRVILTGFARVNPQLRVNAPTYGMDNWIYAAYPKFGAGNRFQQFSDFGRPIHFPDHAEVPPVDAFTRGTDIRFQLDPPRLEGISGNSQFGLAFSDRGHRFTSWNSKHIQHVVIESRYLSRNPYLAVPSPAHSPSDHGDAAEVYPLQENPTVRRIRPLVHIGGLGHFTSACGHSIYTGGNFPPEYAGAYFVCEPVANLVHRDRLIPQGATFVARRGHEKAEFLASEDGWFLPVFTATGPDGALYVVDFHRKVVEHPEWIRKDLMNDQELFSTGKDRGRIYRIVHESSRRVPRPRLDQASTAELVEQLSNRNRWWRITAQRLLVERRDPEAVARLEDLIRNGPSPAGRSHALWTLEGLGKLSIQPILDSLDDASPAVREQAIRLAEKYLSDARVVKKLFQKTADPDGRVLFQLACTLGGLPSRQSFAALQQIVARRLDDPWLQIAALTSASDNARQWFRAVLSRPSFLKAPAEGRITFLQRVVSIIGARQKAHEFGEVLGLVARSLRAEPAAWQAAALEGLAQGMKRGSKSRMRLSSTGQHILLELVETPALSPAALEVATRVRLQDSPQLLALLKKASQVAPHPETALPLRVRATRILGLDATGVTLPLLAKLATPQQPEEIQVAAAKSLLAVSDPRSSEILLQAWSGQTAVVRETVLAGFFNQPRRLAVFLDAVENDRIPAWSLSRLTQEHLMRFEDPQVRQRTERLFAATSTDRTEILEKYRSAAQNRGQADQGVEVFKKHCSQCHRVGETGVNVGPNLLSLAHWPKEQFLENILNPNGNIVPGYEEYMIETQDGRIITGVMAEQSATTVTLRRGHGAQDTVLRSTIAGLRPLTVSAMPEDLERTINVDQMADLLEYLKTMQGPPPGTGQVHGHY